VRSRWNLPIYLVYVVLCVGVIGYIVAQMGITLPGSHPYALTITFHDAAGLLPNNEVFMNGTKVGHVDQVQAVNGAARVTVIVEDAHGLPIHPDAVAEVRKKNLLGETYVDLQRGGKPGSIASGGEIPMNQTITSTQIDEVLAVLDPQTVQRVQLLINAAGGGLANNGDNLNAEASSLDTTLTQLNGPAGVLAARKQQVQAIVLELQKFYDVLAKQREQIRQEFGTWNQVMSQLASQDGSIGATIQQADLLVTNIGALVTGEGSNIKATLAALPAALAQTNEFLNQSNGILTGIAPYRRSIHDLFPHLASSFADTDANGQHFWSLYAVNCITQCGSNAPQTSGGAVTVAPTTLWATMSSDGSGP